MNEPISLNNGTNLFARHCFTYVNSSQTLCFLNSLQSSLWISAVPKMVATMPDNKAAHSSRVK